MRRCRPRSRSSEDRAPVTVYVDNMYKYAMGRFGRMKMSHMAADTTEELVEMAGRIGVAYKWIQEEGTEGEHFDIAKSKRALAVAAGAVEVTLREMSMWMADGRVGDPRVEANRRRAACGNTVQGLLSEPETRKEPDEQ